MNDVETLLEDAVRQCRPAFWNLPLDAPLTPRARTIVRQLRKYGGAKGWFMANDIETMLRGTGDGAHGDAGTCAAGDRAESKPE